MEIATRTQRFPVSTGRPEMWARPIGGSLAGPHVRIGRLALVLSLGGLVGLSIGGADAQVPHCDPARVVGTATCAKCHAAEHAVWTRTPHCATIETLHRNPEALEIARRLGYSSIKRNDVCVDCHYTSRLENEIPRVAEGISCESCHGAARDWVLLHSDYGGLAANKHTETEQHRLERLTRSVAAGMRNPKNVYSIARSCLQCHTVPNERLINVGGHSAGSQDFELVRWSQGLVRHNFLGAAGGGNEPSSLERLRVMYVAGLIADLEFSTRATAGATEKSAYGLAVAARAASVAVRLFQVQQRLGDRHVHAALEAFAAAELKINNAGQLGEIADRIQEAGWRFADTADGRQLGAIDSMLPDPVTYR